jgi:hypothetical protein
LETTGLEGLAAMISALAAPSWVGRKDAALPAATGKGEFSQQHAGLGGGQRTASEFVRGPLRRHLMKDRRVRSNHLCSFVMVFKQHRYAPW